MIFLRMGMYHQVFNKGPNDRYSLPNYRAGVFIVHYMQVKILGVPIV